MRIPGRLRDTTLGDVLGTLHRAQATGYLELCERAGPTHRVELRGGTIVAIESSLGPRLGELLELDPVARRAGHDRQGDEWLARGLVSQGRLRVALSEQLRQRLELLFAVDDADLRFHVPRPQVDDPTAPSPLRAQEFLSGRPRRRRPSQGESRGAPGAESPNGETTERQTPAGGRRVEALRVLGLDPGATPTDVQKAFRRLAQQAHPDRHPHAPAERRIELLRRFAELSRAYHALVG
ncbi:MAG TPA: J domain-containing protein [Polyangiaceae bacterium]|nr:J domain-containing protein [Polyangiaceae bacterium]